MSSTLAQQKLVAIAPKFTAAISVVSSGTCIFINAFRGSKKDQNDRTYRRLVLGMSACDLLASMAWFFTTWPIPKGTPGVYGAIGNQQTCSTQAFFTQFSLSTAFYNASLATYYVLVIAKGWKAYEVVKIEPLFHFVSIAVGLGTALGSLRLELFNQVGWDCWISSAPLGCQESWKSPDGTTTCERGDNGTLYQWAFYYGPLWFVIALVSCLMYWMYSSVRFTTRRMSAYTQGATSEMTSYHKRIAVQAFYYVGAFLISWFFPTIFQLVIVTTQTHPFPLLFLTALFVPIQGLLNLIVFIRPNYIRYRQDYPDGFFLFAWFRLLRLEICEEEGYRVSSRRDNSRNGSKKTEMIRWESRRTKEKEENEGLCDVGAGIDGSLVEDNQNDIKNTVTNLEEDGHDKVIMKSEL